MTPSAGRLPACRRSRRLRRSAVAAAVLAGAWLAVPLPDPPFPDCYGTVVLDAGREVLHASLAPDQQWRLRLGEEPLSPKLAAAVVAFEDRRFWHHPGIDPLAVARAAVQDLRAGAIVSGASTLTMQVARLMRPKRRTLANKLLEMAQAVKLELHYSKQELLRLYLEHAPYGGNLVGVTAASLRLFGRPPSRLTWAEAATLAVLPNAPTVVTTRRNRERLLERRNRLLERLHRRGEIDLATLRESLAEPLPDPDGHPMPRFSPHLARRAAAVAPGRVVRTTVERSLQEGFEALAGRHARWLSRQGIDNLAVLAVETETGAVRAYVGSPDFFDLAHAGQVDGVVAPRSSGSVLKPFLYALAFDAGLLHPSSLMRDVPVYFGDYAPVNADLGFSGVVRARDALVRSLNVPPTLLLEQVGVPELHSLLSRAGMTTLFRPPSDYGLSLILGGAETTLWDLAGLYRGLARDGRFDGLTVLADRPAKPGPNLLSPAACRTTLDILTEVRRPDDDGVDRTLFGPRRRVAWKTGTSFGKRDAWAVGVTPGWVVAVWVGNFSGRGNASLGGAAAAAPILFAALELLPDEGPGRWFEPPLDVRSVTLCAETGYRAGPDCPHPIRSTQPRRAPPLPPCRFHRAYWIDRGSGLEVCSRCWGPPGSTERQVRLVLPPDAAHILRRSGHVVASPPTHRPGCPMPAADRPLRLLYPAPGATLVVPRDLGGERQRVTLRAAHASAAATLYWYLDQRFEGATRGEHSVSLALAAGRHRLEVVDQDGRAAETRFTVAGRS